ncbi:MAG: tagaturonate reductase [Armatimonadota bacterium]
MAQLNRSSHCWDAAEAAGKVVVGPLEEYPVRVLQFGEGNFLRAFVDWMFNRLNAQGLFNGSVVVVQPIARGMVPVLNAQEGLYTLLLRGLRDGEVTEERELITAVRCGIDPYADWAGFLDCARLPELRFIVSNTTEAGIAYMEEPKPAATCPDSFPAKVAAFLYTRYRHFAGAAKAGMVLLPCELIDRNGDNLKRAVLQHAEAWKLEKGFCAWVEAHCRFLNTLVDRIVTGYPANEAASLCAELGYEDKLLDTGELFHLWVIEGDCREELPFTQAGLNVIWTDNMEPYRTRKVRILNGAHTMTVLAAYLAGKETVREAVEDPLIGAYMRQGLSQEIIPTLELPEEEKLSFAVAVLERFRNPFIRHLLLSITLNSVSKFAVRVLPSLLQYHQRNGELPTTLVFSLAALIAFYRGEPADGALQGSRDGQPYAIKDDAPVLAEFAAAWNEHAGDIPALCRRILARADWWGQDLTAIPGLAELVTADLQAILTDGVTSAMRGIVAEEVSA